MQDDDSKKLQEESGVSRRDFLKISGITISIPMVVGPTVIKVAGEEVPVHGPGKVPVTLAINGKRMSADLEPRVTLLEALRNHFDLTGAKEVCDRAECGACTVLMDGKTVYSCSVLAIDAQEHQITTIESLTTGEKNLTPVEAAFVQNDAQQCGFCTPGFILASHNVLQKHPSPTHEQAVKGLGGNFCRCGTYRGMQGVMAKSSARKGA